MANSNDDRNVKRTQTTRQENDPGEPGGGAGRRDEVGGSGVYPASAGSAPSDSQIRTQNTWGQGDRGAAGYEDSGSSELHFSKEQIEAAERGETGRTSPTSRPAPQTKRSGEQDNR
ncbi:MAG TPA: hypothetical protein VFL93_04980 [Longimicrobiaceae bacterium]|nr:hypothetical protein [Longimicrobiaceae bacterium]